MGDLIERGDSFHLLRGALDQAVSGVGCTALVSGEAGIGKTALVAQLVRQHGNTRVLRGGCEALSSPRPLGPLYDMANELGPDLQAMLGLEGHRSALFQALLQDMRTHSPPTLIVIEDLHWADAATLDWIKFLARRISRIPAMLVLTYRDDELGARHPLRAVLGDLPADAVVRVPLFALSESGVMALAQQSNRSAVGLYAATGGNPFFVTQALLADGLPATVRDAVLARATRQPPKVRAILDLIAIVPGRIDVEIVKAVLEPESEDVATALDSGLVKSDGKSYAFRHELARIAVEKALPAPVACELHAKVLECMELNLGVRAVTCLVHHAASANDTEAVLRYAPQAAAQAASHGAHREAASLYSTALEHSGGLNPLKRADFLEHRAYQCYLTDQIEDAIAARLSALAIWRSLGNPVQEGRALRWLSRLHWFVARNREAEDYANQAVQTLEKLTPGPELAWALSNRSQLHMLSGHTTQAVMWGTRAIAMASDLDQLEIQVHAWNNVGTALYDEGDPSGKPMLEKSLRVSLENRFGEHVSRAYSNLISSATVAREYTSAQHWLAESAKYFADRDLDAWSNYVLSWQARVDFEQGRWNDSARLAGALVRRMDVAVISRIPALTVLARIRQLRGDPGARALLEEATKLALEAGELQRLAPVAVAIAEYAWLKNDGNTPHPILLSTYELALKQGKLRATGEIGYWCQQLSMPIGDQGAVEQPYALLRSGHWRDASDAWLALGCQYDQAHALMHGDEVGMREALAMFEKLGATAAASRCREKLHKAGIRGVARGPRASTTENVAGLTTRELQIVDLLAQGLSNAAIAVRLVRSEKTVDHHVSAIYRKLEVGSRHAAVTKANQMGLINSERRR